MLFWLKLARLSGWILECLAGVRGHLHRGSSVPVSAQNASAWSQDPTVFTHSGRGCAPIVRLGDLVSLCSTSFRAPLASSATAGVRFFEPDVSCVVPGVYIQVISSLCFYVIGWHWVRVIQLVSSGTLAGMMGVAVAHDDTISLAALSRLGAVVRSALIGYYLRCSERSLRLLQLACSGTPSCLAEGMRGYI